MWSCRDAVAATWPVRYAPGSPACAYFSSPAIPRRPRRPRRTPCSYTSPSRTAPCWGRCARCWTLLCRPWWPPARLGEKIMLANDIATDTRQIPGANLLNLLIVDDERAVREACREAAQGAGFNTFTADSAEQAYKIPDQSNVDIVLLDLKLPGA